VCINRTKPVQDLELPVHEGFQVGNSEQSDQRLPRDDSRHLCCNEDLGQEHCRTEREDHSEQDAPGGQGLCESYQGVLTTDIFFVNNIPFFLTLSRKICFTAVNHLKDRTVPQIFKYFKEMFQYYLQRGFHITTVHADGEFAPLKTFIEAMRDGPMVNLASAKKHATEIERRTRVVKE
jgi:hypothetical protein